VNNLRGSGSDVVGSGDRSMDVMLSWLRDVVGGGDRSVDVLVSWLRDVLYLGLAVAHDMDGITSNSRLAHDMNGGCSAGNLKKKF